MSLRSLKRSKLFYVLRDLILAEVALYVVFLSLALSADWGEAYEGLIFSQYVRFEILEFSLLGVIQLVLIFFIFMKSAKDDNVQEMVSSGESGNLEFKTSLRWDLKRGQLNKDLEKSVMKTISAFLNSDGGHLVIGIDDKGKAIGLDNDFGSLPKSDADGFENHFNNIFKTMIGAEFRRFVKLKFDNIDNKKVCLVNVEPSHKPVYLKTEEGESFYIRTGNVSTPLKMSEVATYVASWWRNN